MTIKIFCMFILLSLFISVGMFAQQVWIPFDSTGRERFEITDLKSSSTEISFSVTFHGLWKQDTLVKYVLFQRIQSPSAGQTTTPGEPELPCLSRLLAIPECDSVVTAIQVRDSIILNNYNVFPAPLYVYDSVTQTSIPIFVYDTLAYSQEAFIPESPFTARKEGALRNQKLGKIFAYPVRYNPVTDILIAYKTVDVRIIIYNADDDVNTDVGLFANIANKTLLNYDLTSRSAATMNIDGPSPFVHWISSIASDQADTIQADYLIIALDDNTTINFFQPNNPNSPLYQFAQYRSQHSYLDIAIVRASTAKTYHPPYPFPQPVSVEQHIRALIQQIYLGKHANHTFDQQLAYVLLVGRAQTKTTPVSDLLPAAYDQNPGESVHGDPYANDYYYSCLTIEPGSSPPSYDAIGDLFIGRFSVDNDLALLNVFEKIYYFENEATLGLPVNNFINESINEDWFRYQFYTWVDNLYQAPYATIPSLDFVAGVGCQNWGDDPDIFSIYNEGILTGILYGHSGPHILLGCDEQTYYNNLDNAHKNPFIVTHGCEAGWYDYNPYPESLLNQECIAEKIVNYDSEKGFVGIVAASRILTLLGSFWPHYFPSYFFEYIPKAIYDDLSTIAGECILQSKISLSTSIAGQERFAMNYFGDPALDILSAGRYITGTETLNCPGQITAPVIVKSGGVLIIPDQCHVEFVNRGSIYIETGATLKLGDDVEIFGSNPYNNITVDGSLIGTSGTNHHVISHDRFTCFKGLDGNRWGGLIINGLPDETTFSGCDFCYGDYSFTGCELITITNNFSASSKDTNCLFHISSTSDLVLSDADLLNSQVLADLPAMEDPNDYPSIAVTNCSIQNENSGKDYVIRVIGQSFDISGNTMTYNDDIGIDIQDNPYRFPSPFSQKIDNNSILHTLPASNNGSIGIHLYTSNTDITSNTIKYNDYGIVCTRNSVAYIPPASQPADCQQQTIAQNYTTQLYVFNSSWPPVVRYNFFDTVSYTAVPPQIWVNHTCPYCVIPDCNQENYIGCKRDIRYNNWSHQPMHEVTSFYPHGGYVLEDYCTGEKGYDEPGPDETLYNRATDYSNSGNYALAGRFYDSLIALYPTSLLASPSIKNLYGLVESSNKDFQALKKRYQSDPVYYQTDELSKVTEFMIKECNVKLKNYTEALSWLDKEVMTPDNYVDSICALIDMGYINILMQKEELKSIRANAPNGEKLPLTSSEFDTWYLNNVHNLFRTHAAITNNSPDLTSDEGITLISVIPNPAISGYVTINFVTSADDQVDLNLFDLEGKLIYGKRISTIQKDITKENLNLQGFRNGMYILKLLSEQTGTVATHKLIINHE